MLLSFFLNYRKSGNKQSFFSDKRGSARAHQLGVELVFKRTRQTRGKFESGAANFTRRRGGAEVEIFIVEKGEPYRDRDGWG